MPLPSSNIDQVDVVNFLGTVFYFYATFDLMPKCVTYLRYAVEFTC